MVRDETRPLAVIALDHDLFPFFGKAVKHLPQVASQLGGRDRFHQLYVCRSLRASRPTGPRSDRVNRALFYQKSGASFYQKVRPLWRGSACPKMVKLYPAGAKSLRLPRCAGAWGSSRGRSELPGRASAVRFLSRRRTAPSWMAAIASRATHLLIGDLEDFGPFTDRPVATCGVLIETVAAFPGGAAEKGNTKDPRSLGGGQNASVLDRSSVYAPSGPPLERFDPAARLLRSVRDVFLIPVAVLRYPLP